MVYQYLAAVRVILKAVLPATIQYRTRDMSLSQCTQAVMSLSRHLITQCLSCDNPWATYVTINQLM